MEVLERLGPKRAALNSCAILDGLSEPQLDQLVACSELSFFPKNEVIWRAGAMETSFGVVVNGFVKMSRCSASGQELITEIMGPGQAFGILGTLDGKGCPQSATAMTATTILRVNKLEFLKVYGENHYLKDRLLTVTTKRLRRSFDTIGRLASGRVEARVAAVLIVLSESYGKEIDGTLEIRVPLSRQDLADIAGTTIETAIRVMSGFRKQGIVKTVDKRTAILDRDALDRLSNQ